MKDEKIAVIGGSNAYKLLEGSGFGESTGTCVKTTPFGKSAKIYQFIYNNKNFLFLSRHGDEGYGISAPFVNYRANIWALKECGVTSIIAWSGPGIINRKYSIGEYVLPHDFIDETKSRNYTFFEKKGIGFIRQKEPFCYEIRRLLAGSAEQAGISCHTKGVYVCTEGPRLETAAEIRKYKMFGGDMVGMTIIPEAQLARELEMCYAPLCYLTNYAEGVVERSYKKGELFEGMMSSDEKKSVDKAIKMFPEVITNTIALLHEKERVCECNEAMLRYKKRGDISEDWRTWIE